ncbi:hypothetical protein D910_11086 [Dendroctonus ponderosae]|uniref:Uncharacterized protein n=1 Tax=Dendroctonus ponderosae TaxID=77166 RepID=U4UUG3_DENPD|nr:hypothetical protein D910_11086 [Dendroctonus ponderosae]
MRHLLDHLIMLIILANHDIGAEQELEFTDVDVAKLATHTYGTELLFLENSHYTDQQSYKLEDFFWTGSGDGPTEENVWTSEGPSTVYKTSTIISTVFVENTATKANDTSARPPNCTVNCLTSASDGEITPTPTFSGDADTGNIGDDFSAAKEQFWLLTVLKSDGKDPVIIDLKNSLANLYKTAFQRRHIFERAVGHENKGLVQDEETASETQQGRENSPTYINFADQHVTAVVLRPQSSFSGTSSSSLDISPLMNIETKHKPPPKKPPRPRAALNKTVPVNTTRQLPQEVFDSDSSLSRKDESPEFAPNMDPGVMSPKSFLSMPSVKSFPRTNMPEPLNRVLEPVSVTHLDMPDDGRISARDDRKYGSESLIRHGSIGTMEDPGVIGPIVWNRHCDRLKQGVSVDQGINELNGQLKASTNISRMRKRFHDLLDDTFSLFGNSRKGSPTDSPVDDRSRPIAIEVKSHSANDSRPLDIESTLPPRPKTSGSSKPPSSKPSCAWSSSAPSPLIRPLSAAPRIGTGLISRAATLSRGDSGDFPKTPSGILKHPKVTIEPVLAEGRFRPSDPAISVIQAIKSEIEKVSLPGSSTDLHK